MEHQNETVTVLLTQQNNIIQTLHTEVIASKEKYEALYTENTRLKTMVRNLCNKTATLPKIDNSVEIERLNGRIEFLNELLKREGVDEVVKMLNDRLVKREDEIEDGKRKNAVLMGQVEKLKAMMCDVVCDGDHKTDYEVIENDFLARKGCYEVKQKYFKLKSKFEFLIRANDILEIKMDILKKENEKLKAAETQNLINDEVLKRLVEIEGIVKSGGGSSAELKSRVAELEAEKIKLNEKIEKQNVIIEKLMKVKEAFAKIKEEAAKKEGAV